MVFCVCLLLVVKHCGFLVGRKGEGMFHRLSYTNIVARQVRLMRSLLAVTLQNTCDGRNELQYEFPKTLDQ